MLYVRCFALLLPAASMYLYIVCMDIVDLVGRKAFCKAGSWNERLNRDLQ